MVSTEFLGGREVRTHRARPVQPQYYDLHGHSSDRKQGVDEARSVLLSHAGVTLSTVLDVKSMVRNGSLFRESQKKNLRRFFK